MASKTLWNALIHRTSPLGKFETVWDTDNVYEKALDTEQQSNQPHLAKLNVNSSDNSSSNRSHLNALATAWANYDN